MDSVLKIAEMTVDQALSTISRIPLDVKKTVAVKASDALNQVLAEPLTAQKDVPAFDNSAMDGYVFRADDLGRGMRKFPVVSEIRPEDENPVLLEPETCARIMTGAPVPENGGKIVPVELIRESDNEVEVLELPDRNPIRKRGEGYKSGRAVLETGTIVRPYEVGLIIESGNQECLIRPPLNIAIQVTGSEIDDKSDTNGPVLEALLKHWPGVNVKRWPVLEDETEKVAEQMEFLSAAADVVITTGGISAGRRDYIADSMNELGAETLVRKVKQKPGKPLTVSLLNKVPFFHLPGNPVSAIFCAELYLRTFVCEQFSLPFPDMSARITSEADNHRGEKTLFLHGKLGSDGEGRRTVTLQTAMRSHLLQLYTGADVYARLEPESSYSAGEEIRIIPFSNRLHI